MEANITFDSCSSSNSILPLKQYIRPLISQIIVNNVIKIKMKSNETFELEKSIKLVPCIKRKTA